MSAKPTKLPDQVAPAGMGDPEHYDDAIVGRAFRWSLILLVVLAAIGAVAYLVIKRKAVVTPPPVRAIQSPVARTNAVASAPKVIFTDVTEVSGIRFSHNNGATGEKLLPETMGGGVAFFDFDGDGDHDLVFVNSTWWPGQSPPGANAPTMALYRNDSAGHFTDVTAGSGLDVSFYGMGVAAGDFDNDGLPDLFVTGVYGNHLFHNEGQGHFKEVTSLAGVGGSGRDWSSSAAWLDYDNDGRLDLFVCNYVKWSREIDAEVGYKIDGKSRAYGQPFNFEGAHPLLYHNVGGGRFEDVSAKAGVQVKNAFTGVPACKALGVSPVDLDGDGWIDIVVANDTVPNAVFHNQRDGTFREIGALSGVAFDSYGNARGAMGIDVARFRADDAIGIAIGNFANEMTALYVASSKNPMVFTDEAITERVGPASRLFLKFGIFFFDYDLDGRLDLLTANGHLESEISKIQRSQQYRQPAQLFWNAGPQADGCFVNVGANEAGLDLFKPVVGRGLAFADIDGDGDLDVVITQIGGSPLLLRNDQKLGHHWVRLKLEGIQSNRDGIGAWVHLLIGGRSLWRQVMPTRGYLSQSELPVTIGLGAATSVEKAEVIWPGNNKQPLGLLQIDRVTMIRQESLSVGR